MRRLEILVLMGLLAVGIMLFIIGCSPDCEWSATIRTWVDENENGAWETDESPLANVKCFVESFEAAGTAEAVTNEEGKAQLFVLLAGCPREVVFFVYVIPPSGYRLTAQTTRPKGKSDERVFEFGFVPIGE